MVDKLGQIIDGMVGKVKGHIPKSRLPYGFGPCEYPLEQKRITLIQLLRRYGQTPNAIAHFLNGMGQPRRVGQGIWNDQHIRYLLRKYPVTMDLKCKNMPADIYETLEHLGLEDELGKKT